MKNKEKRIYIITILITVIMLTLVLVQNFVSFYQNAVLEAEALGQSCLTAETEQLEAYINKSMNTLKVVSDSVEFMLSQKAEASDIEQYLISETEAYMRDTDENCTGIYGVINGEYVDGVGWIPDKDYVPFEREWYKLAFKADGETAIVPPYIDAQTGNVIISISKMLTDKKSVLSFDIVLNNVQLITEKINLNNKGYGFIITDDGLVIAHFDKSRKGVNFLRTMIKQNWRKE